MDRVLDYGFLRFRLQLHVATLQLDIFVYNCMWQHYMGLRFARWLPAFPFVTFSGRSLAVRIHSCAALRKRRLSEFFLPDPMVLSSGCHLACLDSQSQFSTKVRYPASSRTQSNPLPGLNSDHLIWSKLQWPEGHYFYNSSTRVSCKTPCRLMLQKSKTYMICGLSTMCQISISTCDWRNSDKRQTSCVQHQTQ